MVISRGGIMYFADPVAAFANIGRALKPGGRLAFVCAGVSGEDDFGRIWEAMMQHVSLPDPSQNDAPGPVSFTDRDRISKVLAEAGFGDVIAKPIETVWVFGRDAEDASEFIFGSGPVRHWLRDTDPTAVAHRCPRQEPHARTPGVAR